MLARVCDSREKGENEKRKQEREKERERDLQAKLLIPFGIECSVLDGRRPDELGRQGGVKAVSLFALVVRMTTGTVC